MRFDLRVLRSGGSAATLQLDAVDAQAAAAQARQQGYAVLKVKAAHDLAGLFSSGTRAFPIGLFSQELLTLLEAGLSVVDALETLQEKETRSERQRLLARIVALLYEGCPLSQALQQASAIFPPLYIATIRASERTGDLPEALTRYVAYQAQLDIVQKKIVSAAIYPVLLMMIGLLVIVFLMAYVVPRFSHIFAAIGGDLPFMSRMLIDWGNLVQERGGSLLLIVLGGVAGGALWLRQAPTRQWIFERLTAVPTFGERLRIYQLARFYRTVGMLLRGGTAIMPALQMTADLLPGFLRQRLDESTSRIRAGMPISVAMESCGLTTSVSLRMLRVGERSGRIGEMMERIARFHDEETARWVDWFVRLFEPLLMAFIGIAVGGIVVMMYFPIFELAGSIQ